MATKFAHTNLIARDFRALSTFYQEVFGCTPILPERDLKGEWLDRATGIGESHIRGIHLRLPGWGEEGPTLEIFQYNNMPDHPEVRPHTPGFSHIAFAVDDVAETARQILSRGGKAVGELTVRDMPGVGALIFQYLEDPEGNIVEIQNWRKTDDTP